MTAVLFGLVYTPLSVPMAKAQAGQPDTQFGSSGEIRLSFGHKTAVRALVPLADDAVALTGSVRTSDSAAPTRYFVAKLTRSGALDPAFGADGVVILPGEQTAEDCFSGSSHDGCSSTLATTPSGALVTARCRNGNREYVRLTAAGRVDADFGATGIVTDGTCPTYGAPRIKIDGQGRLIALTAYSHPTGPMLEIRRYEVDGDADPDFGVSGRQTIARPVEWSGSSVGSLNVEPGGAILVSATGAYSSDFNAPNRCFYGFYRLDEETLTHRSEAEIYGGPERYHHG